MATHRPLEREAVVRITAGSVDIRETLKATLKTSLPVDHPTPPSPLQAGEVGVEKQ